LEVDILGMARATTGLSYLTFGLVFLGSLIFTVFVIVPQWGTYRETNQKYAEALQVETDRKVFLENLDARLQDMQKYTKEQKELSLALPDKFMQSNLWVNIENMASSAGVALDSISEAQKVVSSSPVVASNTNNTINNISSNKVDAAISNTAADSKLENWDTKVSFRGNYSQIRAFVKNLEDSLILSDLRDISIGLSSSNSKDQPSDILAASMTVRTYVQP